LATKIDRTTTYAKLSKAELFFAAGARVWQPLQVEFCQQLPSRVVQAQFAPLKVRSGESLGEFQLAHNLPVRVRPPSTTASRVDRRALASHSERMSRTTRNPLLFAILAALAGCFGAGCFGPTQPTRSIATNPGPAEPGAVNSPSAPPEYISTSGVPLQPLRTIRDSQVRPAEHSSVLPLDAWTEQQAAADALGRIGPPAVPPLVAALESSDPQTRLRAAEVLARMGSDAKDAVPALTRLLDDPDEEIRKAATRALGQIGPAAEEAVPALVRALLESDSPVVPASAEQEP
jgi:hypothetical protein